MSDQLPDEAVEAAMKAMWFDQRDWRTYSPGELTRMEREITDVLQAALPHLRAAVPDEGEVVVRLSREEAEAASNSVEASLAVGWGSDNEAERPPGIGAFKSALSKLRSALEGRP